MNDLKRLSRDEMKNVKGGKVAETCGVKVNGTWYSVSGGASEAQGDVGYTGYWNNGTIYGTCTNWCCDSCYWNS